MPKQDDYRPTPGFQGSETSSVEVWIYNQGGDPILLIPAYTTLEFQKHRHGPKSNLETANPCLTGVSTFKSIGSPSGNFTLTAKSPKPTPAYHDLFDRINDDDWVDITFKRHGRRWHVMRGLIDEVREDTAVAGSGATSTVFTISGRDFGKVWEMTPIWFSPQAEENVHGHVAARVFTSRPDQEDSNVSGDSLILESPAAAVRGYLFGFLEELEGFGRANWNPPTTMPNIVDNSFVASLFFFTGGFSDTPKRTAIDPSFIMAGGTLWDLAKEWSDPMFTELYVDLFTRVSEEAREKGVYALQNSESPIEDTIMTVVFRDKPFPIVSDLWTGPRGRDSYWFSLPEFIIPREAIVRRSIGKTGAERFNAFFVNSPLYQEVLGGNAIDIVAPLWDKGDIIRHGLRRFDVNSKYGVPARDETKLLNMVEEQREVIRDWYAINTYLKNGTLELGVGMPDVRIGSRARIPGARSGDQDESYYIETVSHNWAYGTGTRTSLGVTRGWRGTDESLLEALETLKGNYIKEPTATPAEETLEFEV